MEILVVDYKELKLEEETGRILSMLPDEDRERIGRFRMSADRIRGAVSAVLIRSVAAKAFPDQKISIVRTEHGKPYISGVEGFDFNISHSGDLIVYASGRRPLGVDVEMEKSIKPEKFRRFFSETEMEMLSCDPEPEKLFFRMWTIKEAFSKMIGIGISILEEEFQVDYTRKQVEYQGKRYAFETTGYKSHAISLCTEGEIGALKPLIVTRGEWDEILEGVS